MFVQDHLKISTKSLSGQILVNVGAICQCTSVLCAKSLSLSNPQIFKMYYKRYGETSRNLFQEINIHPNHHYALHIPEMLRQWGPMNGVSEFNGEQFIGFLKKVKKNKIRQVKWTGQ